MRLFIGQLDHVLGGDRTLIASLGGWDQIEVLQPFISNHGLTELAAPFNDIDQIVDNTVFQAHDNVKISQTNIGVDADDVFAQFGKSNAKIGRGRGLADAALSGCDRNNLSAHKPSPSTYSPRMRSLTAQASATI